MQQQQGQPTFANNFDSDALNIRVNTEPLLRQIELFLRGQKENLIYNQKTQTYVTEVIPYGQPLANEIGIQNIMNLLFMLINKDVVQGNLEADEVYQVIFDLKMDLARELCSHNCEWGISKDMITHINRSIEKSVRLFLSRTKDNKERDSYIPMIKHVETSTINNRDQIVQSNKSPFNWFSSNNNRGSV